MSKECYLPKKDKYALIGLMVLLFAPPINLLANDIIQLRFGYGSTSSIVYATIALAGLYSYKYLKYVGINAKTYMVLVYLLSLISFIVYPQISDVFIKEDFNPLTSALLFFPLYAFPTLIYSYYCAPFIESILQYGWIYLLWIIIGFMDYILVVMGGHYFEVNYMSFSYSLLPAVCFAGAIGFQNKQPLYIIASVAALLLILIGGSRGCFLCGLVFFILLFVKTYGLNIKKLLPFAIIASCIIILVLVNANSLIERVEYFLSDYGVSSRTLLKLTEDSITESESRVNITSIMISSLWDMPLGRGLYGDRYVLALNGNQGYAHSIIWECLVDFGPFFGSIILFWFFISLYKSLKQSLYLPSYAVLIAFFALGVFKLLMSGSFLEEFYFFATLGLMLNKSIYEKKY